MTGIQAYWSPSFSVTISEPRSSATIAVIMRNCTMNMISVQSIRLTLTLSNVYSLLLFAFNVVLLFSDDIRCIACNKMNLYIFVSASFRLRLNTTRRRTFPFGQYVRRNRFYHISESLLQLKKNGLFLSETNRFISA